MIFPLFVRKAVTHSQQQQQEQRSVQLDFSSFFLKFIQENAIFNR